MQSKCPEKGNVREFLNQLCVEREKLTTVGIAIEEKDYRSTIISCPPPALANFASSLIAAAHVNDPKREVKPDTLISIISEEYECHTTHRSNCSKTTKAESQDKALAVTPGKGKSKKPRGVCWNCREKGHFKDKCDKPLKPSGGEKGTSTKKSSSVNAAVETDSDSELEAAFFVLPGTDFNVDSMPNLQVVSDSSEGSDVGDMPDGEDDWFSEVAEDEIVDCNWFSEELSEADWSESSSLISVDSDSECVVEDVVAQVGAGDDPVNSPHAKIFDSGTSQHLSPYQNDIKNFTTISPKPFKAANKHGFSAVGKGELVVDIPNGAVTSDLRLTEVLYSPEVGYTLVSIGRLDDMGFNVTFGGGKCIITGPGGDKRGGTYIGSIAPSPWAHIPECGKEARPEWFHHRPST